MQALLILLAAICGTIVLFSILSRLASREDFRLADLWQPVRDFFQQPAALISAWLRFTHRATLNLSGVLLICIFALALCSALGWTTLARIFYGFGASCVVVIAVLWRPFYLVTEFVAEKVVNVLPPGLVETIQGQVRWVTSLIFWACIPLVLTAALIPKGASFGAVLTVVGLGLVFLLGAALGYWTIPNFISMKLLKQKIEVLIVVAVITLYVPSLTSYFGWIGVKASDSVMPERQRVSDEALIAETTWFTANGHGRYYACEGDNGVLQVYTVPGRSPETNQELEEVSSPSVVAKIKDQAKSRIEVREREKVRIAEESSKRENDRKKDAMDKKLAQESEEKESRRKLEEEKAKRDVVEQKKKALEAAAHEREKRMQEEMARRQEMERLVNRYNLLPAGSNKADQTEVAVVFLQEATADFRDRVLQPSFVSLTKDRRTFLPAAINAAALNDDGELQRLWNGDVLRMASVGFEQRVDYILLVGAKEETTASKLQTSLSSLHCTVMMKLYDTNPLRLIKTLDVIIISPGLSRDSMLSAARKRLEEELGKAVPNLF